MAKHKKTLEQKRLSDMRHQVYSLDNFSSVSPVKITTKNQAAVVAISPTSYLKKDILKTAAVTFSILAAQIILHFLLQNHTVSVPFVSY